MLGLVIWDTLDPSCAISDTIAARPQLNFAQFIGNPTQIMSCVGLFLYLVIPHFSPTVFQRISMAKDIRQVKKSFTYSALFLFILTIFLVWIGLLLLADNVHLDLKNNNLIAHLIERYTTVGFKGLLAIGIMAMMMSSADSSINAGAIMFTNDFLQPVVGKLKKPMLFTRLASVVIGSLGLVMTFFVQNFLHLILLIGSFYLPIITVPFLLTIFGFRSTTRPVLIGMSAGAGVVFTFFICFGMYSYGEIRIVMAMLGNVIAYMGSHYLLKSTGGWVGIQDKAPLIAAQQARRQYWAGIKYNIKNFQLYPYLKSLQPRYSMYYILLGMYLLGVIFLALYHMPQIFKTTYPQFYKTIRYTTVLIGASFITFPIWPPRLNIKNYIIWAWPIANFMLCLISSFLAYIQGFTPIHLCILMFNLIFVTLMLRWYISITIMFLSLCISYIGIKSYLPIIDQTMGITPINIQFLLFIMLLSIMIVLYLQHRYVKERLYAEKNNYLQGQYHDTNKKLQKAENYQTQFCQKLNVDIIQNNLTEINAYLQQAHTQLATNPQKAGKIYQKTAKKLANTAGYLQQVIYIIKDYRPLKIEEIDVNAFINQTLKKIKYIPYEQGT